MTKKVSDQRLSELISFASDCSKPWICIDVVEALNELQTLRSAAEPRARRISCSRCVQANGCADGECRFAAALPCGCEPGRTPEWIRRKCGCLPNDAGISVCPYCQHVNGGHSLACTAQNRGTGQ